MMRSKRQGPLLAATLLLVAASLWPTCSADDATTPPCLEAGDKLVAESQFQAAAAHFLNCSTQAVGDGQNVTAGLALFKAYKVFCDQLSDLPAGLAACKRGWEATHAAELAWCAATSLARLNQTAEAMAWARDAINAGCYNGTCTSVQPTSGDGRELEPLWDAPFGVLQQALDASGDSLGAAQAFIKMNEAKTSREWDTFRKDDYIETLAHVNIPTGPLVHDPMACGNSQLQLPAGENAYTPRLHIIATATDLNMQQLVQLMATADVYGLHVSILSPTAPMGHAAGGKFGMRLQLATNFMNMLHEEDFIMSVDAYDVAFAGGAQDIIQGFRRAVNGRDVALFGAETGLWPDESLDSLYPAGRSKYRYLNAGMFMGSVRAVRCLMAAAQVSLTDNKYVFNDDQLVFSTIFLHTINTSRPLIALDYGHDVFAPLWDKAQWPTMDYKPIDWDPAQGRGIYTNKLTGGTPCVFHANGNQPLSFLWDTLVPMILNKAKEEKDKQRQLQQQLQQLQQQQQQQQPSFAAALGRKDLPAAAVMPQLLQQQALARTVPHSLQGYGAKSTSVFDWIRERSTGIIIIMFGLLILCEVAKAWHVRNATLPTKTL